MAITYSVVQELDCEKLLSLYDAVGWTAYTQRPENLAPMVANSWYVCAALDGTQLVGMVRVVSDGLTIAYIQDLLVLPSHQRQGIASELMRRLLVVIENAKIRQTYLTTDAFSANQHVIDFYTSLGFIPIGDYECTTLARFK
ncbi:GNAT family N-acetyltransferase [Rothia terrae]|uniref:GNAT family N-acetyltransferase n=1 Tax=Rothia terrae TaxID=396015 RepID=UPI001447465C|nr:GNAT family N-acetyltransferase [Rothia terrae]NKZ34562.1 GNAT family N-acetyltransferase [Rothia terrae]